MRILGILMLLSFGSCGFLIHDHFEDSDESYFDVSREDGPEDAVTPSEVRARIISDVRIKRQLRENLHLGQSTTTDIIFTEKGALCRQHEVGLLVVRFPTAVEEGRNAIREKAYFCGEGYEYWYRWQKLSNFEEKWFGAFPSKLRKVED